MVAESVGFGKKKRFFNSCDSTLKSQFMSSETIPQEDCPAISFGFKIFIFPLERG